MAAGFVADFSNTTGPKQAADGLHDATIKEATAKLSDNNNPTIALKWVIDDSEDEASVGRTVYDNVTLTESAFWRAAQLVQACELDTSSLEGLDVDMSFAKKLAELLLGESIVIETKIKAGGWNKAKGEKYADRATVTKYHPHGHRASAGTMIEGDEDLPY